MKAFFYVAIGALLLTSVPGVAQTAKRAGTANGYHHTTNSKAKARAGAYSRYSRAGRRNEEDLKLAPGLRLNMPSPPTTDYMGRPLKKKTAPVAKSGATTLESDKKAPASTATKRK